MFVPQGRYKVAVGKRPPNGGKFDNSVKWMIRELVWELSSEQVLHHCMGMALLRESNSRDGRQALEQGVQFNSQKERAAPAPRGEQSF